MAYSARLLATNELQNPVFKASHNYHVGDILGYNVSGWFKCQADSEPHSQVIGMVSNVADDDHFFISQIGFISNIETSAPFVAGTLYYLDPAAPGGGLTATKPVGAGQVVVPLFYAYTSTSGYFAVTPGEFVTPGPSGFTWNVVTVNTTMLVNNGYIINAGGPLEMTLPAVAVPGNMIRVCGYNAAGWKLKQNAGQTIHFGLNNTTGGAGGEIDSTNRYDNIEIVCVVANTDWVVLGGVGNMTIV